MEPYSLKRTEPRRSILLEPAVRAAAVLRRFRPAAALEAGAVLGAAASAAGLADGLPATA